MEGARDVKELKAPGNGVILHVAEKRGARSGVTAEEPRGGCQCAACEEAWMP